MTKLHSSKLLNGGEAVSNEFYFTRQLHENLNTYVRKKSFSKRSKRALS